MVGARELSRRVLFITIAQLDPHGFCRLTACSEWHCAVQYTKSHDVPIVYVSRCIRALFQTDDGGHFYRWQATACGRQTRPARTNSSDGPDTRELCFVLWCGASPGVERDGGTREREIKIEMVAMTMVTILLLPISVEGERVTNLLLTIKKGTVP